MCLWICVTLLALNDVVYTRELQEIVNRGYYVIVCVKLPAAPQKLPKSAKNVNASIVNGISPDVRLRIQNNGKAVDAIIVNAISSNVQLRIQNNGKVVNAIIENAMPRGVQKKVQS